MAKGPTTITFFEHAGVKYRVLPPAEREPDAYLVERDPEGTPVCRFLAISGAGWFPYPIAVNDAQTGELWRAWMDQAPLLQKDLMVGSYGGVVTGRYLVIRSGSGGTSTESFQQAVDAARQAPREVAKLLEVSIRRIDRPGYPWVCAWTRQTTSDPWAFVWHVGADDRGAEPLPLESWHVFRRFASVGDPRPGIDDYLDAGGGWTSNKGAAQLFDSEGDASAARQLAKSTYVHQGESVPPAFGVGRS
jgi:hypothetical protein